MNYDYDATHTFRFDLDTPVFVPGNREVDRIKIEFQWVAAEPIDDQPEGWWVTASLHGWPLTAKGARDKRVKDREFVSLIQYPKELQAAVWEAFDVAVDRTHLDTDLIVNPNQGLFDEKKWEARPDISMLKCSDCGVMVTYADEMMWPWLGVDGSSICTANRDVVFGHRLDRTLAEEVWYQFEKITGQRARHAI